jgi:hypothetical protein
VRPSGAVPRVILRALGSPGGRCYRHCDEPVRARLVKSRLPGTWTVRACPSGVVSVTSYAEWTRRDPTVAVRKVLQSWTVPRSLVRTWDLRLATRHGPELGRVPERILREAHPSRGVRAVYWRVYPYRARDNSERRLFVCFRRGHTGPVFFGAPPSGAPPACPVCRARSRRSGRRARRPG